MKETFNGAASLYDQSRPSYPKEVMAFISDVTKLNGDEPVLEIGPGTGQATKLFLEKGHHVTAIELGTELAQVLKSNCPENLDVIVGDFDLVAPELDVKVPLVVCATAFHWLNKETRYRDCSRLLSDEGHLVLIWNNKSGETHPIIRKAYEFLFGFTGKRFDDSKDIVSEQKKDIENSDFFELKAFKEIVWTRQLSVDKFKDTFYTQSSYLSLSEEDKQKVRQNNDALFEGLRPEDLGATSTTIYVCSKINKK